MTLWVAAGAGLVIALGGLVPAVLRGRRWPSTLLLGWAGGAVLGIVGLEVLPAAREWGSLSTVGAGVVAGFTLMGALHLVLDSLGHRAGQGLCPAHGQEQWLRVGFLTWLAVAVHNVLDGFGIGAGFGESGHLGMALAAAVAVHNLPVGMLVGTPLVLGEAGASRVVMNTVLAGMCTPLGALLGEHLAGLSTIALGASLGLAGGSLLFILGELLRMSWCESRLLTVFGGSAGFLLAALPHVLAGR